MANFASAAHSVSPNWVFDTGASHHITTNLNNMHLHSEYDGPEEVMIGDGTGLKFSHVGSTSLPTPNTTLKHNNVVCVPNAKHNLISVKKFCKSNDTYLEFCPSFFCVKDQVTGAALMRSPSNGDLYTFCPTPYQPSALTSTCSSSPLWHARFGHPSNRVLAQMMSSGQI